MNAEFFVVTDMEKVEPLKATTYEEAFSEIERHTGMTWVLDRESLVRLRDRINDEITPPAEAAH